MVDISELGKYPHLKEYYSHFENTGGLPEKAGYLSYLVIWIRMIVESNDLDPVALFEMDEETAEDFYSWGHNSRWANAFATHIETNPDIAIEKCLELAAKYGDPLVAIKEGN